MFFILLPFLWRNKISTLFKQQTSSPSITIKRRYLYMKRFASIWIAVKYAHGICAKGENISVLPSKAGTASSQVVLLQCPAKAVVCKDYFHNFSSQNNSCYFYWFREVRCSLASLNEVNNRSLSLFMGGGFYGRREYLIFISRKTHSNIVYLT